jgi:hypothetical protein
VAQEFELEQERAEIKRKACEDKLPPWDKRRKDFLAVADAWMDACLYCESGKACIEAMRLSDRNPELSSTDTEKRKAALAALGHQYACR